MASRSAARLVFAPPAAGDAQELAIGLRRSDRREIEASSGPDLVATIRSSIALSTQCWTVRRANGSLVCIFGVAPVSILSDVAAPWLLATPLLGVHRRTLIAVARAYVAQMLGEYPVLTNYVDDRNAPSIRFLRWLGFSIGEPERFGVAGRLFRRFELRGA